MIDMKEVLDLIHNSRNIVNVLCDTYEKPSHLYKLRGTINKGAPLFTRELYLMILKKKCIPSVEEFSQYFADSFFPRGDKESAKMQANLAYKAILTDIHFYFLLSESNLFDKVEMSFSHDIFAKSDVLVMKDDTPIGLQLFSGDEAYISTKLASIERIKNMLSYRLHAIPLKKRDNYLDARKSSMSLYTEADVREILNLFGQDVNVFNERLKPERDVDRFVTLQRRYESTKIKETMKNQSPLHSVIYGGTVDQSDISVLRQRGVKVHHIDIDVEGITPFQIVDGCPDSLKGKEDYLKKYGHLSKNFNYNQYIIEHADPAKHIAINASAGSGKTTTLIERIMYLLDMGMVESLDQITMITFTNEAANNLEEALSKRLIERFKMTGDSKYMMHINNLRRMDILTIPSFAKNILKTFGQYLGLGEGFRVSKMKMERRRMIDRIFDEILQKEPVANPFDNMWYSDVRGFLENVWDKFEQKGVTFKEFSDIKMDEKESDFTKHVIEILRRSDEELYQFKRTNDIIGVSDLTRFMKFVQEEGAPFKELSNKYRYMFVDEFQDTDISQIQIIVSILAATEIRLIAVGDVKQGIYRFRGADSSAFTVLDEMMKLYELDRPFTYQLNENFRSSRLLVEQMEEHFKVWRQSPLNLLPDGEGSDMVSRKEKGLDRDCLFLKMEDIDTTEIKLRLNEIIQVDETGKKVLAILVRTNAEAKKIGEMIREDGHIKNFEVRMNGTLFESDASRDLLILINSWIHSDRRDALHALSTTAYAEIDHNRHMFERKQIRGITYMSATSTNLSVHKSWRESLKRLKFSPLLPVIDLFIEESNYKAHLRDKNVLETDIRQYELNLNKIMMLIHETFADGPIDLLSLYEWMEMQISTNREADEAELNNDSFEGNPVRVITVHRSKGLQFDTVMIPYTKNSIVRRGDKNVNDTIVYVAPSGKIDFAWKYVKHEKDKIVLNYETSRYGYLKREENDEQTREETRLLYVAMTRAEERLFIYGIDDRSQGRTRPNTWRDLLKMARRS